MNSEFSGGKSNQVHWARYDWNTQVLEIDFKDKNGNKASTYQYFDFTLEDWSAFERASSKGSHFAKFIRNKYRTVKKA